MEPSVVSARQGGDYSEGQENLRALQKPVVASDCAEIFPGLPGLERVFTEKTANGGESVYLEVKRPDGASYARVRLATGVLGAMENVRFRDADNDGDLDVQYDFRAQWGTEPPDLFSRVFTVYHKEFKWEVADALEASLNDLYYTVEEREDCAFPYALLNELEFPQCQQNDVSGRDLESRVWRLERDVSWLRMDVRQAETAMRSLERRVANLETPGAEVAADSPDECPDLPAAAPRSSLEMRVMQLEGDVRFLEMDVSRLRGSADSLDRRVRALEEAKSPVTDGSAPATKESLPIGKTGDPDDVEDRLDDFESRLDDLESRVDDLESR